MALRAWFCLSLLATSSPGFASARSPILNPARLSQRERETWKSPVHAAQFSAIPYVTARLGCEVTQLPEALASPDPLFVSSAARTVKVSVIVGTDGRVHTPLILESGGVIGDRNILETVRAWRYRPATCNGVPTEAEGRIEFSRR
jgi:TonB family protein